MGIPNQSDDFTPTVLVPKAYENHIVKNQLFMCLPPACFENGFGFVSGFEEMRSRNFPKNPKIDEVIEGENFFTLDCNNYTRVLADQSAREICILEYTCEYS